MRNIVVSILSQTYLRYGAYLKEQNKSQVAISTAVSLSVFNYKDSGWREIEREIEMLSHVGKLFVLSQVLVITCALIPTQKQITAGRGSRIAG